MDGGHWTIGAPFLMIGAVVQAGRLKMTEALRTLSRMQELPKALQGSPPQRLHALTGSPPKKRSAAAPNLAPIRAKVA